MSAPLAGKVAVVTGAGQGVGRGVALALAASGAAVALVGRTAAKVEAVAREVVARGGTALPLGADVAREDDIGRVVAHTVEGLGSLDILVNNAQDSPMGPLGDVTEDALRAGWESGPLAVFRLMRACRPHLRSGGVIVTMGSGAIVNPRPVERGVYAAVKSASQVLTRVAAVEWAGEGIRAFTVMPAAISPSSEVYREKQPEAYALSMQAIPAGRLGDPESDIGPVVAFLCTPAARYLTGTTVAIDGGQAYLR